MLLLEDESGRIAVSGVLGNLTHLLVTGVCVAIKGRESTLGTFQVSSHSIFIFLFHMYVYVLVYYIGYNLFTIFYYYY
jgi:hypothetical protein